MNRRDGLAWLLLAATSVSLVGCDLEGGSDDDDDVVQASVRLVNLTRVSDLLLTVDDSDDDGDDDVVLVSGVQAGTGSSYESLDPDTYSLVVSSAGAGLSASSTSSLTLAEDTRYTIVAYERGGLIKFFVRTEDADDEPSSGYGYVTAVNAGSDAGTLDVYIVTPDADISELSPTISGVSAASSSLTYTVSSGSYDVVVTANNKPEDVRLRLSSVTVSSKDNLTFALTPTSGGALVHGALIQQGGSVALYRADTARVRVIAAFAAGELDNQEVDTIIGEQNLGTVTAPATGNYSLVTADTTDYQVSVNGVALLDLPDAEFASGGDYTVLVYGTDETDAAVSVLTDNNQLPSSGAKIRLINGAVSAAGLSLSANYSNLFSEVGYGRTSAYSGISSGTTRLDLTSPALAFDSYSSSVNILSGGVYSLMVLGDTDSAIVLLNKDR